MDEIYRNLWIAVLKQAIGDVAKYSGGFLTKKTLSWFEDESEEIGSFIWICSVLDLNPNSIRHFVRRGKNKGILTSNENSPSELQALKLIKFDRI